MHISLAYLSLSKNVRTFADTDTHRQHTHMSSEEQAH